MIARLMNMSPPNKILLVLLGSGISNVERPATKADKYDRVGYGYCFRSRSKDSLTESS